MNYHKSTSASNVDVHWLTVTKAELLAALSVASGQPISTDVRLELDDDGGMYLEWHTPKGAGMTFECGDVVERITDGVKYRLSYVDNTRGTARALRVIVTPHDTGFAWRWDLDHNRAGTIKLSGVRLFMANRP